MGERPAHDEKLSSIMRAAAVVFAQKGYHQASVRDISRATGISLAGLYHYFRGKEELLFLIQDHCFATVLENLERRLDGVREPDRRLRVLVENHLRFFVANMQEMKVLSHEADSLTGDYLRRVNARKRKYVATCTQILGALRPAASEAETRTAAFALFGMLNWVYNWYQPGRDPAVTELAERMCQLFLRGYLATGPVSARPEEKLTEAAPSIWRR
jgi:TetR/AcrR family transcriptional regulator, cholesterol catabolism regulator